MSADRDRLEGLLIDYIDGSCTNAERREVDELLKSEESARALYAQLTQVIRAMDTSPVPQPSHRLQERFKKMLDAESGESAQGRKFFITPTFYRVAAAVALLVIGGGTGYWISRQQLQKDELMAMKQEMEETRNLVISLMSNEYSASQRLQGVQAALTSTSNSVPDDHIVHALIKAMTSDQNTNVRLAALEAFIRFREEPGVRTTLIESLSTQTDPLVQMAIIQLMVEMKEKDSLPQLRELTEDENFIQSVRDEASAAVIKLQEV